MSGYAVPFLYGMVPVSFDPQFHPAMSCWSFVLMGVHLGLHIPAMISKLKLSEKKRMILCGISAVTAGYGLFLFRRDNPLDHMLFKNPFAFFDHEKARAPVIAENLLKLILWAINGAQTANLCTGKAKKQDPWLPVVSVMAAVIIGSIHGHLIRN